MQREARGTVSENKLRWVSYINVDDLDGMLLIGELPKKVYTFNLLQIDPSLGGSVFSSLGSNRRFTVAIVDTLDVDSVPGAGS